MDDTTVVPTVTEGGILSVCQEYNLFTVTSRWIIGVMILASNVITLTALTKAKKGIGQKGKIYVMSLSCADLLSLPILFGDLSMVNFGIFCMSAPNLNAITENVVWKKRLAYQILMSLTTMAFGCSLASLLFIAIDRLLAVSRPIFYKHHITKFKIRCLLVFFWIYQATLTLSIVFYFGRDTSAQRIFFAYDVAEVITDFYYSFVILPHIYFYILSNTVFFSITAFYIRRLDLKKTALTKGESFKRTKIFMKMSGMTLLGFFILWSPFLLTASFIDRSDPNLTPWVRDYAIRITYSIVFSNSWINPVLYCCFNKDYREAYKRLLKFKPQKVHSAPDSSSQTT